MVVQVLRQGSSRSLVAVGESPLADWTALRRQGPSLLTALTEASLLAMSRDCLLSRLSALSTAGVAGSTCALPSLRVLRLLRNDFSALRQVPYPTLPYPIAPSPVSLSCAVGLRP
jgi:hypothetical protein